MFVLCFIVVNNVLTSEYNVKFSFIHTREDKDSSHNTVWQERQRQCFMTREDKDSQDNAV